jgi:hypothetical protein
MKKQEIISLLLDLQNHFIDEGLNKHIKMYNRVDEQIEKLINDTKNK